MELFHICAIDYPRWPPGTITKNSINTKMTISQDPLVEIDPTLCQTVSCMNPLYFFAVWDSKMAAVKLLYFFAVWDSKMAAVTKNSAEHDYDNISITA